jgi:hypothetical protein
MKGDKYPDLFYYSVGGVCLEKRDWTSLKNEYAVTNTSLRRMAESHGIPFNTIKDRAKRDEWTIARKTYRDTYTKNTIQKTASKAASACAKQLSAMGRAAELATHVIERMMVDSDQFRRHLVQTRDANGSLDVQERVFDKYDTKALREFTSALKDLVRVIRDVYGLPTIKEQAAMDIALKRLLLYERKACADEEGTEEYGVVFLPPVQKDMEL